MSKDEENVPTSEDKTPLVSPGNYSPVTVYMEDTLGTVFLGILTLIMLIGWRRAELHNRRLMDQLRG